MSNVTAEGDIGPRNYASSGTYEVYVDQCIFVGTTSAIDNDSEFTLYVGGSKLDGDADGAGTYNCIHCYDGDYAALDSDCQ